MGCSCSDETQAWRCKSLPTNHPNDKENVSEKTIEWFESFGGNTFKIREFKYCFAEASFDGYGDAYKKDGGVVNCLGYGADTAAGYVYSCGSRPEHWFAIITNEDEETAYRLHFVKEGLRVDLEQGHRESHELKEVQGQSRTRSGREIADWLKGVDKEYSMKSNNCQHFVQKLAKFM